MGDVATGEQAAARRRLRWPIVAAGVLLLTTIIGLWGWFSWLPHYRPARQANERYGVDVSNHQGNVDWPRVARDDIEFAYIKASEGGDFVDEWFDENWAGTAAAGLDRGAYHFFTLCRPGAEQAANFLDVVPSDPAALPPAIDLELAGNCAARPDRSWVETELRAFLDAVESATGQTVVLYLGDDFEDEYRVREALDRPLWLLRYLRRPDSDRPWIWQVHGFAIVDGIEGGADLNVMRGEPPAG